MDNSNVNYYINFIFKIDKIKIIIKNKKNILILFFFWNINFYKLGCLDLCCINRSSNRCKFWIFYNANNKYFLGFFFFKEILSFKGKISVSIVIFSILFLIIINFNSIPWVGLIVAFSWSFYNLLRKKIKVETDIGLLIESLFILPVILIAFYFIVQNNFNDFDLSNPKLMLIFMLLVQ